MKTTFTARHFESSNDLKQFSLDSVDKLEQFLDKIIVCDIVLQPGQDDDNPYICTLNVKVPNKLINVTEESPSYEQAVSAAVETAIRQIRKYKTKHFEHQ